MLQPTAATMRVTAAYCCHNAVLQVAVAVSLGAEMDAVFLSCWSMMESHTVPRQRMNCQVRIQSNVKLSTYMNEPVSICAIDIISD